jgi:hypothetical protein
MKVEKLVAVFAVLALSACGVVVSDIKGAPPVVHPNSAGQIWVSRTIWYSESRPNEVLQHEATGLFACYPSTPDKPPAPPICYLARYVRADGTEVDLEDVKFPHAVAPAPAASVAK